MDDSEQPNCPRRGLGRLRAFGAVIVPEPAVAGYATDLKAIKQNFGLPETEEVKWKPRKGTSLTTADGAIVTALRQKMLDAAIAHDIRTAVVIVDHDAVYSYYSAAELGQKVLLPWLYERISYHLDDNQDLGIVIADKPGGGQREESRWLAETLQLTNDGTEYVNANEIVMPILTADSHHVPHLQLADLVTAATTAAIAGRQSGLNLAPQLFKLMHRNKLGTAGGAGLVLWPAHRNLMYWCFGETVFAKPSSLAGVTIPYSGWSYYEDSGLHTV